MYEVIHGGDIYQNQVTLDFSVNINPLGIPEKVLEAMEQAMARCTCYPDMHAAELVRQIGLRTGAQNEQIICGNGASELFLAIVHAVKPSVVLIPTPSFYGFERAAQASGAQLLYYEMPEAEDYCLTERFLEQLTEEVDLIYLANPNNPVGNLLSRELLWRICDRCRELQITVVLDECFLEFTREKSLLEEYALSDVPQVIIVRAFTKIYAIPGVRLGYLLNGSQQLCRSIREQLPEWNLSCFAQAAGTAAMQEQDYCRRTIAYVEEERSWLTQELRQRGMRVWQGCANFLFFYSEEPLYDSLLRQGILIRDCSNYRGLTKGYYRIAVKTHAENQKLIEMVGQILGRD